MSDASKSLDVLIRTQAEFEGAKELADSLEKQIAKAKLLGEEYDSLENQLHHVHAAMAEFHAGVGEAEKKTSFLHLRSLELKKLIRELGMEFPLAGQAAKFFMNPLTAGLSLVIGLFALAKRHLDDWNKALDEAAAKAAQRDFLPGFEAATTAMQDGAREAGAFKEALTQIGIGAKTVEDQLNKTITKIREIETSRAGLLDAQLGLKLSQINLAEKQGRITPEAADIQRYVAQSSFAKQQEENRKASENTQLAAQQNLYDNARLNQSRLEADAAAKQKAAADAKAQLDRAVADRDHFKGLYTDKGSSRAGLADAAEKANAEFEKQKAYIENRGGRVEDQFYFSRVQRALRAKEEADAALRTFDLQTNRYLTQQDQKIPGLQRDVDRRNAERDAAEEAARANQKFITDQRTGLPDLRGDVAQRQAARNQTQGITERTRATDLAANLNGALNEDQKRLEQLLNQMIEALKSGNGNTATIAAEIAKVKADQAAIQAQLQKLQNRLR